jgi:acyl-ACP thioesterase
MVGHMNNTKYIQLFLDYYSAEFHKNHSIKNLDINFKNEAQYQDKLVLSILNNSDSHLIELKRKEDGKVNCLATLVWESKNP